MSGIGTVSALAVSRTAYGCTARPGETDPIALLVGNKCAAKPLALGYANRGECGNCAFFKIKPADAFGSCPMSAQVSRWQQRPACSTFTRAE
jgi:hypothetical protein